MPRRYARSSFPALVYCGTTRVVSSLLKDSDSWEDFTEETLAAYIREGTATLIQSLKEFTKPETPYRSLHAKELRFMLEALLEVKEVFAADQLPVIRREA